MADSRERWALILGGSSGMGEATARALAAAGYNICGIHLDFRAALQRVEELKADLAGLGREVLYINMNAADDEKRAGALARARRALRRCPQGRSRPVRPRRHALARVREPRAVHRGRPEGRRRPQEDGDDPGRDGEQPRLLGPGPVPRRVPRRRLEGLRDDVGGLDPRRADATASCRRRRRPSSRTFASSRWSSPARTAGSRSTRSARA